MSTSHNKDVWNGGRILIAQMKTELPSKLYEYTFHGTFSANQGALKMHDVKMQDVKMTDQVARHEIAGHEIATETK